jgi:DNA-nicking Smr family endonuclease
VPAADEILAHLDKHGVRDKDAAAAPARTSRTSSRVRTEKTRGGLRAVVDLHGLTEGDAGREVRRAFERCAGAGIRRVLLIHGQGLHSDASQGPVLGRLVRAMLENELRRSVRDFRTAAPRDGGEGATEVWLA